MRRRGLDRLSHFMDLNFQNKPSYDNNSQLIMSGRS